MAKGTSDNHRRYDWLSVFTVLGGVVVMLLGEYFLEAYHASWVSEAYLAGFYGIPAVAGTAMVGFLTYFQYRETKQSSAGHQALRLSRTRWLLSTSMVVGATGLVLSGVNYYFQLHLNQSVLFWPSLALTVFSFLGFVVRAAIHVYQRYTQPATMSSTEESAQVPVENNVRAIVVYNDAIPLESAQVPVENNVRAIAVSKDAIALSVFCDLLPEETEVKDKKGVPLQNLVVTLKDMIDELPNNKEAFLSLLTRIYRLRVSIVHPDKCIIEDGGNFFKEFANAYALLQTAVNNNDCRADTIKQLKMNSMLAPARMHESVAPSLNRENSCETQHVLSIISLAWAKFEKDFAASKANDITKEQYEHHKANFDRMRQVLQTLKSVKDGIKISTAADAAQITRADGYFKGCFSQLESDWRSSLIVQAGEYNRAHGDVPVVPPSAFEEEEPVASVADTSTGLFNRSAWMNYIANISGQIKAWKNVMEDVRNYSMLRSDTWDSFNVPLETELNIALLQGWHDAVLPLYVQHREVYDRYTASLSVLSVDDLRNQFASRLIGEPSLACDQFVVECANEYMATLVKQHAEATQCIAKWFDDVAVEQKILDSILKRIELEKQRTPPPGTTTRPSFFSFGQFSRAPKSSVIAPSFNTPT